MIPMPVPRNPSLLPLLSALVAIGCVSPMGGETESDPLVAASIPECLAEWDDLDLDDEPYEREHVEMLLCVHDQLGATTCGTDEAGWLAQDACEASCLASLAADEAALDALDDLEDEEELDELQDALDAAEEQCDQACDAYGDQIEAGSLCFAESLQACVALGHDPVACLAGSAPGRCVDLEAEYDDFGERTAEQHLCELACERGGAAAEVCEGACQDWHDAGCEDDEDDEEGDEDDADD